MDWTLSRDALILHTLQTVPLVTVPGTTHAYSNFGYCLLGRIVEIISGMDFEQYVCQHIFVPCHITNAFVEKDCKPPQNGCDYFKTTAAATDQKMTTHVCEKCEDGWYPLVRRFDSHGGWCMSASDLIKFSVALDQDHVLLSAESRKMLLTAPSVSANYAMGFQVGAGTTRWHTGSIDGTGAILVKTKRGGKNRHWGLVINSTFVNELDRFGWEVLETVEAVCTK